MNILSYIMKQRIWSGNTFGYGKRTKGIVEHIKKELKEIEDKPSDVMEWIDVVILALDGAWRAGYSPIEIVKALQEKQDINFKRIYPKPESEDLPSEHIRT